MDIDALIYDRCQLMAHPQFTVKIQPGCLLKFNPYFHPRWVAVNMGGPAMLVTVKIQPWQLTKVRSLFSCTAGD